jgi:hypothetical protein
MISRVSTFSGPISKLFKVNNTILSASDVLTNFNTNRGNYGI